MSDVIDAMRRVTVMVWLGNNMGIIFYCDILEARNPAFKRKSKSGNEDSKKLEVGLERRKMWQLRKRL